MAREFPMFPPDEKEEPCFFTYEHIDTDWIARNESDFVWLLAGKEGAARGDTNKGPHMRQPFP